LSQKNYHVFCAERAQQALEILETEDIDLLITDIIMPDMDGYALAAIVQQKYPDIKIQLASGFSGKDYAVQTDESLLKNLLQKPYNTETLLRKIRALLH
jgi:YesN/AraC family two-component response regulator